MSICNTLRPKFFILAFIIFTSCSNQLNDKVLVFELQARDTLINIQESNPDLLLSRQFINYLIEKFPNASNTIFFPNNIPNPPINLTDSTYSFGIITGENRIYLINTLPKNLSKEESDNYWKRIGFFYYTDSTDISRQDSLFDERTKWTKAPTQIENEYAKFYSLINNLDKEYIIVAPKGIVLNK